MTTEIRPEPYDSPAAQRLVAAVQREYVERYGGPDRTPVAPRDFAPPCGEFLVAYVDGVPTACGGFRIDAKGTAEIKRMYVAPTGRRRGLARTLLAALEAAARRAGCAEVILETGTEQPEAVALYESAGYSRIPDFGVHTGSPGLRCYGKRLR